jgi:hypothetical protein
MALPHLQQVPRAPTAPQPVLQQLPPVLAPQQAQPEQT